MKKNSFFFILTCTFLLLCTPLCHGQSRNGYQDCQKLYDFLQKNNCNPQIHPLIPNTSADFPFNITVDFYQDELFEPEDPEKEYIDTLIILFAIQDIQEHYDFLKQTIKSVNNYSKKGNVRLAFTYGENSGYTSRNLIAGTPLFAEECADSLNLACICVKLDGTKNTIIPGSGGDCAPAWLIQLITDSLFDNNLFYTLRGGILNSLYRLNFLKSDRQTGTFLQFEIPACGLELVSPDKSEETMKKLAECIGKLAYNFDPDSTVEWDRHSRPFIFFNRTIFLSEKFSIILFISVAALSLFIICEFSFLRFFNLRSLSRHVMKKCYQIPAYAVLTSVSFFLGQYIAFGLNRLFGIDIYSQYAIKVFFAFLIISVSFLLFNRLKLIQTVNVYSYFIVVTGLFNIFLYSAVDLSLFYLFAAEYLIINLTQGIKRTFSLVIVFLLYAVPFLSYFIQLVLYADSMSLARMLICPMWLNIAFSFAFLPFEFLWFRILIRLNYIWQKIDSEKKGNIRQNLIAIGSAVFVFAVILAVITAVIPDQYKKKPPMIPETTRINASDEIKISSSSQLFLGDSIRTFSVEIPEPAENLTIEVHGNESNPVLYSDELFYYDGEKNSSVFMVPAWCPPKMTFSYIEDNTQDSWIKVYKTERKNGSISITENEIFLSATAEEAKNEIY